MRGTFPAFWNFLTIRCPRVLLVPVTLAGLLTCLGTATASAATCVTWSGTSAVSPGTSNNLLAATTVLSPCDAWAVGWASGGSANRTLIEHWDGAAWTVAASPNPGASDDMLNGVHAISADDVWAVGAYSDGTGDRTLIVHWNGTKWTQVTSPNPGSTASLSAIDAVSASDAWAVGDYTIVAAGARGHSAVGGSHTLALHWNGTKWAGAATPSPANPGSADSLRSVAVASASNAWAVEGVNGILHWDGQSWTTVATPQPPGAISTALNAVASTPAGSAWAVGVLNNGGPPSQPYAIHCC